MIFPRLRACRRGAALAGAIHQDDPRGEVHEAPRQVGSRESICPQGADRFAAEVAARTTGRSGGPVGHALAWEMATDRNVY